MEKKNNSPGLMPAVIVILGIAALTFTGYLLRRDWGDSSGISHEIIREDKSAEPSGEEQAAGAQAEAGPSAEAGKPGEDGISGEAGASEETGNPEENGGAQNAAAEGAAQTDTDLQEPTEEDLEDLLEYVDAWQVHHTMRVDSKVAKNVYDSDKFEHVSGDVTKLLYHDENYEVLQGIDVCDYKGEIDWKAVSDAGYSFVFVRVGFRGYGREGSLNEDAKAVDYLREAKEAGLEVGTYFFSQAVSEEEAREEARLALGVIEEAGVQTDLPLIYDPETIKGASGRANNITMEQVCLNTEAFRDEVESTSNIKVDLYSNMNWENEYFDAETLNKYGIWYADYEEKPQTPYHFTWWQYSESASVPGIEGDMDLNIWIRRID